MQVKGFEYVTFGAYHVHSETFECIIQHLG
jgi:hypothetical protein